MANTDENTVRALQLQMWHAWNTRSAAGMAALCADDCNFIGYDGSPINGRAEIEANMGAIFKDHTPATYVGIIREVRFLSDDTALVRSVAGMIPPGKTELNPERNAIISLVAVKHDNGWKVALYHNTPARFDGRPEAAQQLTDELRQMITAE